MTTQNLPENLLIASTLLSLRWNVVTEAISLQATLVFGLLRYARNDKKQDGHEAKASRHDKSDYVRDDNLLLAGKGHLKKTF